MGNDSKTGTEQRLKSMRTTPRQSRMLLEWNIPASTADCENPTGPAWSGKAIADMLPDEITDRFGNPASFAVDKIWYKGASPMFNGEDPMSNLVAMVVWLVRSGFGDKLNLGGAETKPFDEFVAEKEKEMSANYAREARDSMQTSEVQQGSGTFGSMGRQ